MDGLALRMLVFCLVAIAMAVPASAQTVPKVELSGGYQFLNFSLSGANEAMPAGWYVDVAGNLTSMLGVVFQVGGNYKSFEESASIGGITARATADVKVHDFLGGVRLNLPLQQGHRSFRAGAGWRHQRLRQGVGLRDVPRPGAYYFRRRGVGH